MFNVRLTIWLFALLMLMESAMTFSFECEEGVYYEKNRCNSCICFDGSLYCSLMECPGVSVPPCNVGSVTCGVCNTCYCTADWGYVCTNHDCLRSVRSNYPCHRRGY